MLVQLVSDRAQLPLWFGQYITQAKHELDQQEPDPHYEAAEIAEYLEEGSVLGRIGGLRCSYYQAKPDSDIQLFINGNRIVLPAEEHDTARRLCDSNRIDQQQCLHFIAREERLLLITDLINQGLWYFEE
ncbi:50S ribosomal protein L16 arginine hydroxylase [Alishewanella longhuensis]